MDGIIIVDKEKGCTSRDVVNLASKVLKTKKVGHTGTLDPLATGVMVLCVNRATKVAEILTSEDKEYVVTVKLGLMTDTLDITGNITSKKKSTVTKDEIEKVLNSFVKTYKQEVPIYSSVKVDGKKLYDYAREGIDVVLPKKEVTIYNIELICFEEDYFSFKTKVSKGTYIRSLIRDMLAEVGEIGVMSELRRTKQGKFEIEDAITIEKLKSNSFSLTKLRDIIDATIYEIDSKVSKKVLNGHPIELEFSKDYILFTKGEKDMALYKFENGVYKAYKVFYNSWN